jgi:hypothetical protein
MGPVADRIVVVLILGGLAAWVGWGWRSWVRRRPERLSLGMRCSLIGFVLASVSAALEIGTGTYGQFINGFPFEDPTLLHIFRWGFLLGVLGLDRRTIRGHQQNPSSMESARLVNSSIAAVGRAGDGRVTISPARRIQRIPQPSLSRLLRSQLTGGSSPLKSSAFHGALFRQLLHWSPNNSRTRPTGLNNAFRPPSYSCTEALGNLTIQRGV